MAEMTQAALGVSQDSAGRTSQWLVGASVLGLLLCAPFFCPEPAAAQAMLCSGIPLLCDTPDSEAGFSAAQLVVILGALQLLTGALFLPFTTVLRIFTGAVLAQQLGPLQGWFAALGCTVAADTGALMLNYRVVRHGFAPLREWLAKHLEVTGAKSLGAALATARWYELALIAELPYVTLLLAPCLPPDLYIVSMTLGRVPAQGAHVWCGCILRNVGSVLSGEQATPAVVVATSVGLSAAALLGLTLLASRSRAVYQRLANNVEGTTKKEPDSSTR